MIRNFTNIKELNNMKHICSKKCKKDLKHFVMENKVGIFVVLFFVAVIIENLIN